ncbi:CRIB domain-containing protein RIC7-like [Vicia villosa]|uniref:CRIB domain-containing protein RIC7-like n=1 Tax=Vicia villosa TaxID=3911 RepID=UPI00273C276B|nr:CRIB domain-containing protein RIC7-like [Vicia villosa]
MSRDNKMKGLLKGLKFITQIFDSNEKEPEIEIGGPTDVKHVAHIGWDGPTENAPSWMNEYNSVSGLSSSAPLNMNGDRGNDDSDNWVSPEKIKRGSRSMHLDENAHELPLPKSSKNQSNSTRNLRESHAKEKADRPRQQKRNSKRSTSNDTLNESNLTTREEPIPMDTDSLQLQETTDDNLPPKIQSDNPKRTNHKKIKDAQGVSGSSKSRLKSQLKEHNSNEDMHPISCSNSKDQISNEDVHSRVGSKSKEHKSKEGSHLRSNLKPRNSNLSEGRPSRPNSKPKTKHRLNEEDGQLERESNEDMLRNCPN